MHFFILIRAFSLFSVQLLKTCNWREEFGAPTAASVPSEGTVMFGIRTRRRQNCIYIRGHVQLSHHFGKKARSERQLRLRVNVFGAAVTLRMSNIDRVETRRAQIVLLAEPRRRRTRNVVSLRQRLKTWNTIPDFLRDNEYIRTGYRANWSVKEAFLSLFQLHNETLNIWTHLFG